MVKVKVLAAPVGSDSVVLWTAAHQDPLSSEIFGQEHWSAYPFPSPGVLPNPGMEPGSSAMRTDSLE